MNIYVGDRPPGSDHGEPCEQPKYHYTGICKAKDLPQVIRLIELKAQYEREKGK